MPRINLWSNSVPRVELDQRSREARLQLEKMERLLAPRAAAGRSQLGRILYLFGIGIYRGAPQENRFGGPLSNRRPPASRQSATSPASRECAKSFAPKRPGARRRRRLVWLRLYDSANTVAGRRRRNLRSPWPCSTRQSTSSLSPVIPRSRRGYPKQVRARGA